LQIGESFSAWSLMLMNWHNPRPIPCSTKSTCGSRPESTARHFNQKDTRGNHAHEKGDVKEGREFAAEELGGRYAARRTS
jgi:hypothetical protein